MGFQASEKGRAGLAKLITPSPKGGYDVRLGASCDPIHVDKVFGSGATASGSQGAISILEAAYYQTSKLAQYEMKCTGYFAFSAQKTITGQSSEHHTVIAPGNKVRDQLTNDAADIYAKIAEGRSVVLGTMKDQQFTTDVIRNGTTVHSTDVKTVGKHQYVVTKAASDGVWVMNPWGARNSADGGGEIWIPREQINHSFSDLAISAPISAAADKEC